MESQYVHTETVLDQLPWLVSKGGLGRSAHLFPMGVHGIWMGMWQKQINLPNYMYGQV